MKFFHTADWHLGKLVQGVYMTDDQRYILEQFLQDVEQEKPDCVIIAGDVYDRAVPPTEAVHLLNEVLDRLVLQLKTPVLAIAGNHDSPGRLHFGSTMMKSVGFHVEAEFCYPFQTVALHDSYGPVYFHLIPYVDPSKVAYILGDQSISTHDQATAAICRSLLESVNPEERHVYIGHAFVTPQGQKKENTSDSERPLSIGGAEQVNSAHFDGFHYVALGHLHQAHPIGQEQIRYAGSPLKYSISEEHHKKGYYIVELDEMGHAAVEQRQLKPRLDMRTIEGRIAEIERHEINHDYVFVRLLDEAPVLSPMERVRAAYPNAMHVERKAKSGLYNQSASSLQQKSKMDDLSLFKTFYEEVQGNPASEAVLQLFAQTLRETEKERDN